MKKSMVPIAFAAAVSLAACGNGTKTAQTVVPVTPSSTSSSSSAASTSTAVPSPTSKSSRAAAPAAPSSTVADPGTTSTPPTSAPPAAQPSATQKPSASAKSVAAHTTSNPVVSSKSAVVVAPTSSTTTTSPPTSVVKVWPDAGWKIQTANTDLCDEDMGVISASPSAFSNDTFTCGYTFESLNACKKDASGYATCIQNYSSRMAVRFKTSATVSGAAPGITMPLAVKLQNGMMCSASSHDQSPHYGDRHGFLYCDNGGTLLLPSGDDGDTTNYFDKSGSTWTAQLGMGTNAPTTVKVAQVYYAQ